MAVDIKSLETMIIELSRFAEQNSQIVELDLNPVLAYKDGAIAVDARIVMELTE